MIETKKPKIEHKEQQIKDNKNEDNYFVLFVDGAFEIVGKCFSEIADLVGEILEGLD